MTPIVRSELRVAAIIISRSTAPVEVREQLAYQEWASLLATWATGASEWAILTTCHRFELYFAAETDQLEELSLQLQRLLSSVVAGVAEYELTTEQEPWIVRYDKDVAEHL